MALNDDSKQNKRQGIIMALRDDNDTLSGEQQGIIVTLNDDNSI